MNPHNKYVRIIGLVLNLLIAALLIFAGSAKLAGSEEMVKNLSKIGMEDKLPLIGFGEVASGLLLAIPLTSPLGTLLVSGFWGGVICIHMSHHDNFIPFAGMLLVTWLGSYLRGSVPILAGGARPAAPSSTV